MVSSDELGELARDFNTMARGLAEREELREHFGTYVDREIVRPDSPRLLGEERFAAAERLAAYRANPEAKVRRDPYSQKKMSREMWANGGTAGRML